MYKKILVPLDGSRLAECALDHVMELAKGCNVKEVDLLFVMEPPPAVDGMPYGLLLREMNEERERMREYLHKTDRTFREAGVPAAGHMILEGEPSDTIIKYAEDNGVDLIVMSTHGRSGISGWAFGSVADRVMRYSGVPVLVITPKECRLMREQAVAQPESAAASR